MTIGTPALTPGATWREISWLVAFLTELHIDEIAITYGWGCNASGIKQPVTLPLTLLIEFLEKNIAQDIYHLGEDNLYLAARAPALKITLCHDADIHFEATDAPLEARLRAEWERRGLRVWGSRP